MQTTPVVEREVELATFSRAIRRAAAGRGAVLAVTGAAGVGKTCLLEQVESEAATAGWFVLSDRAPRSRARRSILLELLEGLDPGKHPLDGPARALRSLASGREVPTAALVGGVRWLLEDLVAERQVLLVVDDLPRGDLASVRTLHALRDEIRSLGCLLVFAVADDEPGAELTPGVADLVAELLADARRLTPAPLTRDAVAALARTAPAGDHRRGGRRRLPTLRRATRARSTTCCTSGGSPVGPRTRCAGPWPPWTPSHSTCSASPACPTTPRRSPSSRPRSSCPRPRSSATART